MLFHVDKDQENPYHALSSPSLPGLAPACLSRPLSGHTCPCSLWNYLLSFPQTQHSTSCHRAFACAACSYQEHYLVLSQLLTPHCSDFSSLMLSHCQCCDIYLMSFPEDYKTWVDRAYGWAGTQYLAKCLAYNWRSINICWTKDEDDNDLVSLALWIICSSPLVRCRLGPNWDEVTG